MFAGKEVVEKGCACTANVKIASWRRCEACADRFAHADGLEEPAEKS